MAGRAAFARMNGIGNEIIVADMRGRADRVLPAAAIALNADPATKFDQIMAIHDARTPGTAWYLDILNSDGSTRAGLRQRHALRGPGACRRDRQPRLHLRDGGRHPQCRGACATVRLRRHGHAAVRLAGHSARRGVPRHAGDRAADRPDRRPRAAFADRRLDGQPARRLLRRRRRLVLRARPLRADAREPPDLSGARQHLASPA